MLNTIVFNKNEMFSLSYDYIEENGVEGEKIRIMLKRRIFQIKCTV